MRPWRMSTARDRAPAALSTAALALLLAGCNTTSGPVQPVALSAVSGSDQATTIGAAAANPLVVLVIGDNSAPFAGATVKWRVTSGGGTLSDTTSTSDAQGHAQVMYTAGSQAGTARVTAVLENFYTATFTVRVEAAAAARGTRAAYAAPLAALHLVAIHR